MKKWADHFALFDVISFTDLFAIHDYFSFMEVVEGKRFNPVVENGIFHSKFFNRNSR
jgi:hypothetical protein